MSIARPVSIRAVLRGTSALLFVLLACGRVAAQVLPPTPVALADDTSFDISTGIVVLKGHARIEYGSALLLADQIQLNRTTGQITANGDFTITSGAQRLLAEGGTYNLTTGEFRLTGVRAGEPPFYVTAASAAGTKDKMTLTGAVVTYDDPDALAPTLSADQLVYIPGKRISGVNGHLGLGGLHFFPVPQFNRSFDEVVLPLVTARAGYRHTLGAYVDLGIRVPVWPGVSVGAQIGEYTARGPMAGPAGSYTYDANGQDISGSFISGFIRDHGDTGTDLLGRRVPADRGYSQWTHQQIIDERLTVMGQINWWSDSAILRDFHPNQFYPVQQPDSFFEGVYAGDNYYIDLFTRLAPNNFEIVQERLPELRFDLVPTPIGGGFNERFSASFAALQEDSLFSGPTLRSDRFDVFYSIDRPLHPSEWLSITPVAGGRLTYYAKAVGDRNDYTRWLGEVGMDAELRGSGMFDYRNALWNIDGLRHLITPRFSYRYIPEIDKGETYIPSIDRRVFSTDLQPLDLGAMRNIDDLHGAHVLRLGLANILQTRDAGYGSRDLVTLDLASDLNISTGPGQHRWSDVYTDLSLTPASWLRFSMFQRLSTRTLGLHEFNARFELIDQDWWTVRLGSNYLQHQLEEYSLEFDRRVNEVWKGFVRVRYDDLARRWNELAFGLRQNLRNTWSVRYEVSWNHGQQRESSFGLNVMIDLIRF